MLVGAKTSLVRTKRGRAKQGTEIKCSKIQQAAWLSQQPSFVFCFCRFTGRRRGCVAMVRRPMATEKTPLYCWSVLVSHEVAVIQDTRWGRRHNVTLTVINTRRISLLFFIRVNNYIKWLIGHFMFILKRSHVTKNCSDKDDSLSPNFARLS